MLQHLYVKDIALIDEIEIDFDDKLNILTGETGAGKSILIGSINIALGQRISKDILREGAEKGTVELLFSINRNIASKINNLGIECEDEVIISRTITKNGRSVSKVNGHTVTVNTIKKLASFLIDIHGQHEHQSLLDEQYHLNLLDMFCKNIINEEQTRLSSLIDTYNEINSNIKKLTIDEKEKARNISILEFELQEIEDAKLKKDEEEELISQRKKLTNSKRLYEGCCNIYSLLHGDYDSENDVISSLSQCINILKELKTYDDNLSESFKNLDSAAIWIEETASDIRGYIDSIDHDESTLIDIENRLDTIQKLKRKYGNSIEDVFNYRDKIKLELDNLYNTEDKIKQLKSQLHIIKEKINNSCEKISSIRKKTALTIQDKVTDILKTLQFEHAEFVINISRKEGFSKSGYDQVEFLINTNIGEKIKKLSDIASGGEMSRIMLALKTILAEIDEIPTLIFDEIDTGISGRTAQKVAEKLSIISQYRQVLCITHLPQIAAMADQHYLIDKTINNSVTKTNVIQLDNSEIIGELARLLSGAQITDTTLQHAKEIKKLANEYKNELKSK